MKKIRKILVIVLLIFPIYVKAEIYSVYNDGVRHQEKYITDFTLYNKTIINGTNIQFGYNGSLYVDSDFKFAGFLNKKEYEISGAKNSFYYDAQNYWLMTKEGSNAYIISSNTSNENALTTSALTDNNGVRYTVYLKKYTEASGIGTYVDPWQIKEINDFSAPVVSATAPTTKYNKQFSALISAKDNTGGSGLGDNEYSYYVSSSDSALNNGELKKYTNNSNVVFGSDVTGDRYLFIKQVSDVVENYSTTQGTLKTIDGKNYHMFGPYKLDNTKPTCTIERNTTAVSPSVTLTIKGNDNTGKFDVSPYSWTGETSGFSTTNSKVVTANGTYNAWIKDEAGNVGKCTSIVINNVDDIKPTCTITKNTTNPSQSVVLTVTGSDNSGSLNATPYSWTNGTSGFSATNTRTITSNGTYTAWVKDKAGNVGSCQTSPTITNIDRTPPTCSISKNISSWTRSLTLTATSSEANSTISWTNSSSGFSATNTKGVGANGTYSAWAKDSAGNVSNPCSIAISNIDVTLPTCRIDINTTAATASAVIYVVATGENSGVYAAAPYSWNNSAYSTSNSKTVSANGTYYGYIKDQAGNVGVCSRTVSNVGVSNAYTPYPTGMLVASQYCGSYTGSIMRCDNTTLESDQPRNCTTRVFYPSADDHEGLYVSFEIKNKSYERYNNRLYMTTNLGTSQMYDTPDPCSYPDPNRCTMYCSVPGDDRLYTWRNYYFDGWRFPHAYQSHTETYYGVDHNGIYSKPLTITYNYIGLVYNNCDR